MTTSSLKNLRISRAAMAKVYSLIADMAEDFNADPLIVANTLVAIKNYIFDEAYVPDNNMKLDDNYLTLKEIVDKAAIRSAKARARHLAKKSATNITSNIPEAPLAAQESSAAAKPAVEKSSAAEMPVPICPSDNTPSVDSEPTPQQNTKKKPRCNFKVDPRINRFGWQL